MRPEDVQAALEELRARAERAEARVAELERRAAPADIELAMEILARHGVRAVSLGSRSPGCLDAETFAELAAKTTATVNVRDSLYDPTRFGIGTWHWITTMRATVAGVRIDAQTKGPEATLEEVHAAVQKEEALVA